jgi:hypothetical protein
MANDILARQMAKASNDFEMQRCHIFPKTPFPKFPRYSSPHFRLKLNSNIKCQAALGKRTKVYETLTLLNVPATTEEVINKLRLILIIHQPLN